MTHSILGSVDDHCLCSQPPVASSEAVVLICIELCQVSVSRYKMACQIVQLVHSQCILQLVTQQQEWCEIDVYCWSQFVLICDLTFLTKLTLSTLSKLDWTLNSLF